MCALYGINVRLIAHMSVMARYLGLLPFEARRRVLTATHWTTRWHVADDGARNLLGHAEDWSRDCSGMPKCGAPEVFFLRRAAGDELWTDEPRIGACFDRLVKRCGMERAVALIRARVSDG